MKDFIQKMRLWLKSHLSIIRPQHRRWQETAILVSQKKRIAQGVKRFFDENYELRYNTIKQYEEFRPRQPEEPSHGTEKPTHGAEEAPHEAEKATQEWRQLTDRDLRRIVFEQMEQVGVAWSIDIELYVRSSILRNYNPIADFLASCPPWDGQTDYIRQLARRVPCSFPE